MIESSLLTELERALTCRGVSLDALTRAARSVVLFGSRAARCAGPGSDWDVLCIGAGETRKREGLDLVWVEPQAVDGAAWLGTDLAGHVAAHGLWISGAPSWDLGTVDFTLAARCKEAGIVRRLQSLARAWDLFGASYREKHAKLVRRDVQRFRLLEQRLPVPPSANLDALWQSETYRLWFADSLRALGATPSLVAALVEVA